MSKLVLVDSSVWIDFFRGNPTPKLDRLIQEDLVCTNQVILTELLPAIRKNKQKEIEQSFLAIPVLSMRIDWEIIRRMQLDNLRNGLNHIGIPDLIILQQVIDEKLHFHSFDKHFRQMSNHFQFSLISQ